MLTHEELDRSRAVEAQRRLGCLFDLISISGQEARILAAKLAREGWMPVDPKLIRAREIVSQEVGTPAGVTEGKWDSTIIIKAVLVALNEK